MPWDSAKRRAAITEGGVQRTDSSPLLTPSSAKRPRLPKRWRTFSSSNLRSRSRTCAAFCHIRLRSRRSGFGAASERLECQSSQASCMTANAQVFDLNLPLRSSPSDNAASAFAGEFSESTQHLLILADEEVCEWRGMHGHGSRRNRRLSCGSAGRAVNVWRTSRERLRGGTRAASIGSWLAMEGLLQRHAGGLW